VPSRDRFADVRDVMLVQVAADVLVHPDDGRMAPRAAHLQRLKHKCRDLEVAQAAPVGDLLELHEARTRGAPGLVGLGLLARQALEIRWPPLGPSRLVSALESCGK